MCTVLGRRDEIRLLKGRVSVRHRSGGASPRDRSSSRLGRRVGGGWLYCYRGQQAFRFPGGSTRKEDDTFVLPPRNDIQGLELRRSL